MNILLLNGNPDFKHNDFEAYLDKYQNSLHHLGHYIRSFQLKNLDLISDIRYILNCLKDTDLLVFATPMINERISALTSNIQESIIRHFQELPAASDHLGSIAQEKQIPLFGMIVQAEWNYKDHSLLLNKLSQERIAANSGTVLSFFVTADKSPVEALTQTLKCVTFHEVPADYITG
jgi:hypothetical protein